MMQRREAIKTAGAVLGGVLFSSSGILSACAKRTPVTSGVLSADDQTLIEEIADTLLPTTAASPGAKAARVGPTINMILSDCYDTAAQQRVVQGMQDFRKTCRARTKSDFASLTRADREALLRDIDREARTAGASHYFALVRELAQGAYFSSEVGATKALRYVAVPGRFDGCVPLKPGQPAWA
jgi:hypothetical protein